MTIGGGVAAHNHASAAQGGELYTEIINSAIAGLADVDFAVPTTPVKKITVIGNNISGNNVGSFLGIRLNGLAAGYNGGFLSSVAGVVTQAAWGASMTLFPMAVLADIYDFQAVLYRMFDSSVGERWTCKAQWQNYAGDRGGIAAGGIVFVLGNTLNTLRVRTSLGAFDGGALLVRMEH